MVGEENSLNTCLSDSADIVDRGLKKKSVFVYNVSGSQWVSGEFLYRLYFSAHVCDKA